MSLERLSKPVLAAAHITWPALVLLASLGALASAYIAEYGFNLLPCILCLYQRVPYAVAALLCGFALVFRSHMGAVNGALVGSALAFVVNVGIAAYHVGVEQHWWDGPNTCAAETGAADSLETLRAQLLAQTEVVPCDVVTWSLFGISFAGYNVLLSLALAAFCMVGVWWMRRPRAQSIPLHGPLND